MSRGGLQATLRLRRGALEIEVRLDAAPGETVALLGPNGAGKTSVVLALAGLLPLGEGVCVLDGVTLDESPGRWTAPERRPVAVVFQEGLLFPHMSALANVAYGVRGPRSRQTARDLLEHLGLAEVAALRPAELSGGQRQRVALARALARRPSLLLLDEPLGALDAQSRPSARAFLSRALAEFAGMALLVTHDTVDAMTLADRIVVMEGGRVVQQGTSAEIAARPRSPYVADFVGLNLFHGRADGDVVRTGAAVIHVATSAAGDVFATLHPRAVALHRSRPDGSARNTWHLGVEGVELTADRARVRLGGEIPLVAEVTRAAVDDLRLRERGQVWAEVKATAFEVYPATPP